MKKMKNKARLFLPFLLAIIPCCTLLAQTDSVPPEEVVKLRYFNVDNSVQYILLQSSLKTGKQLTPRKNKVFQLYLDSNRAENLITKVLTDEKGLAKAFLPPSLSENWKSSPTHTFIAVAEATHKEEELVYEFPVTKARLTLDTLTEDGVRKMIVHAEQATENGWVAAPDVELKIGVERSASILSAGDDATYTTDSAGIASVEFKRDSLPGDSTGRLMLAARAEDNELFGNLLVEKPAGWGVPTVTSHHFFEQRTLWSTRFHTPYWLLFMAYTIVIAVWGTIIYLITRIIKIKKLGTAKPVL